MELKLKTIIQGKEYEVEIPNDYRIKMQEGLCKAFEYFEKENIDKVTRMLWQLIYNSVECEYYDYETVNELILYTSEDLYAVLNSILGEYCGFTILSNIPFHIRAKHSIWSDLR